MELELELELGSTAHCRYRFVAAACSILFVLLFVRFFSPQKFLSVLFMLFTYIPTSSMFLVVFFVFFCHDLLEFFFFAHEVLDAVPRKFRACNNQSACGLAQHPTNACLPLPSRWRLCTHTHLCPVLSCPIVSKCIDYRRLFSRRTTATPRLRKKVSAKYGRYCYVRNRHSVFFTFFPLPYGDMYKHIPRIP